MSETDNKMKGFLKRYPIVLHLLLMIAISAVLVLAITIFVKIYSRQGQEYEMYNLIGKQLSEVTMSNDLELRYVVTDSIYDSGNEPGEILTQDPQPGDKVKKGRKVYLTIASLQPEDVVMPDLKDMALKKAVAQLMYSGLTVSRLKFIDSPYRNAVIGQSVKGKAIAAGEKVARGTAIELTVGRGDNNKGTVVPVVIGKTHEQAVRAVCSSSLNIVEHFDGASRTTGVVYKQDPVCSDVQYPLGSSVEVWYCGQGEYKTKRKAADNELDSLKRVADSIQRALELEEQMQLQDNHAFDFLEEDDMIW